MKYFSGNLRLDKRKLHLAQRLAGSMTIREFMEIMRGA